MSKLHPNTRIITSKPVTQPQVFTVSNPPLEVLRQFAGTKPLRQPTPRPPQPPQDQQPPSA